MQNKFNSATVGKIFIYGFLAIIVLLFFKLNSGKLPTADKLRYLAVYAPALIATCIMFTAGVNWSLGVVIQKSWLLIASVVQYSWCFYFEFMMRASGSFTQLEYYQRSLYYVPVLIGQLLIDRSLRRGGSIETWFFRAKIIGGVGLIVACIWNYMAFDVYFDLKEPEKKQETTKK